MVLFFTLLEYEIRLEGVACERFRQNQRLKRSKSCVSLTETRNCNSYVVRHANHHR
jgi:hypothetical protein